MFDQLFQAGGRNQRHVAAENKNPILIFQTRQRLRQRMSGTQLFGLVRPGQVAVCEGGPHRLAAVPMNDVERIRIQRLRRVQNVSQHRPSGEGLQDFWPRGVHALPLAGGKDDYGYGNGRISPQGSTFHAMLHQVAVIASCHGTFTDSPTHSRSDTTAFVHSVAWPFFDPA